MKFAIYSRKSRFTGKGESIENQIGLCYKFILRDYPGTSADDILIFEDEGFSGKSLDRPQFKMMMTEHKKSPFNYIVVYRLDRISRNVSDFSGLMDKFQNTKTHFISINEKFDTSTPMGRAMINIAAVFAQLERETISERVRDNMVMLARTGRWLGGKTPIGYTSEKLESVDLEGKRRSSYKLVPEKQEEEIIKLIFKLFLEIQSLRGVEKKLFSLNITPRTGTFNCTMIKNIITHPVYCISDKVSYKYLSDNGCDLCFDEDEINNKNGYATFNRTKSLNALGTKRAKTDRAEWIISLGKHVGFIKGTDWVRANKIIDNSKPSSRTRKVHNQNALLSGILKCGICDSCMRPKVVTYYKNTDKQNTFDYMCELKERSGRIKCNCKNVRGNVLDSKVCEVLFGFNNIRFIIGKQFKELHKEIEKATSSNNNTISELEKLIAEKETLINTYILSLGISSAESVVKLADEKVTKLDREIKDIKGELLKYKDIKLLGESTEQCIKDIKQAILSLKKDFDNLHSAERRELLKIVLEKVVWNEKGEVDIFIRGAL